MDSEDPTRSLRAGPEGAMKETLLLRAEPGERTIHPTMELVLPAVRENLQTIRSQVTTFLQMQLLPRRAAFPLARSRT
jgi:hypothetical protein